MCNTGHKPRGSNFVAARFVGFYFAENHEVTRSTDGLGADGRHKSSNSSSRPLTPALARMDEERDSESCAPVVVGPSAGYKPSFANAIAAPVDLHPGLSDRGELL